MYTIASMNEEFFICAEKRLPELARRIKCDNPKKLFNFWGSVLQDMIAIDPIFERELQILSSDIVSEKYGSGINAVIPAHDFKSETICAKNRVTMKGYVDSSGKFVNELGIFFRGIDCFKDGGERVIKKLQNLKRLFVKWEFETEVFYNAKTDEELLLMSLPCFFLRVSKKLKLQTYKELALVNYYPALNFLEEEDETLRYKPLQKRKKQLAQKESGHYNNVFESLSKTLSYFR